MLDTNRLQTLRELVKLSTWRNVGYLALAYEEILLQTKKSLINQPQIAWGGSLFYTLSNFRSDNLVARSETKSLLLMRQILQTKIRLSKVYPSTRKNANKVKVSPEHLRQFHQLLVLVS